MRIPTSVPADEYESAFAHNFNNLFSGSSGYAQTEDYFPFRIKPCSLYAVNSPICGSQAYLMSVLIFREVVYDDIPKLARLHAIAWKETYELIYPGTTDFPTAELREWQWREAFKQQPKSWFCYVVENSNAELIGFAKGQEYGHQNYPGISGELNKIYVLRKCHKQGIGFKLFSLVVSTLMSRGINNMIAFSDYNNPTTKFFERLGGKKTLSSNGESHDAYTWDSLDIFREL